LLAEEGQGALEIVHTRVLAPMLKPVTDDVGLNAFANVAEPLLTVQLPVPDVGAFAASVAEVPHTLSSEPALDVVGEDTLVIVTLLIEAVQGELEIVHTRIFDPADKPVTDDVGLEALANVAEPLLTVQLPVPDVGAFAASVAEFPHTL
jgi:hypothetical protein